MIELECRTCHKLWTQTCEACAEWSAGQHTERTGHAEITTRKASAYRPLPEWFTRGGQS